MSEKIIDYYNNVYCENNRLSEDCDNRHKVERINKLHFIDSCIEKIGQEKLEVLDISCGTGLYSKYLAEKGHSVLACDLVESHIEELNKEIKEKGIQTISTCVCNAIDLPFPTKRFDFVLLGGAIYHLHNIEEKIKAIEEAYRTLRIGGFLIVDFLPKQHGFIQQCLCRKDFLSNLNGFEFSSMDCKSDIFSYDNKKDLEYLIKDNLSCCEVEFRTTDFITRFVREDVNNMNEEDLLIWCKVCLKNSDSVDIGEHALAIIRKVY